MKWSLKVGQLAGTVVYVHVTFFVLLAWIGVIDGLEKGSLAAAAAAVGFTLTLFACVVLHEFGHALMARRFGIRTRDIILFPIGGMGRLERIPDVPSQEFLIALAGPAVSVGIAAALFAALWLQGSVVQLQEFTTGDVPFAERLMIINAGLAVFNLLPAFPMDGGRVLRALLAMRIDYVHATEVAARIGQGIALLFAIAGILMPNPILVIIPLFVWMGALGRWAWRKSHGRSAAEQSTAPCGPSSACLRRRTRSPTLPNWPSVTRSVISRFSQAGGSSACSLAMT
jgi:Zn-dependent protease